MNSANRLRAALLALPIAAAAVAMPAAANPLPDRLELGRDGNGQPCAATRGWGVGKKGISFVADQGFNITCRGVAAASVQGYVAMPVRGAAVTADPALCGAPLAATIAGAGAVDVRRCYDPRLQLPVIDVRTHGGTHGVAVETALVPLEALMRLATVGGPPPGRDARATPAIDAKLLAPAPVVGTAAATGASDFTAASALQQGVALVHAGRHVEASRLLNDAISQFSEAPALVRAELRLNAALADSNLSQFESATGHFAAATSLLESAPPSDTRTNLDKQAAVYRALDQINRKRWGAALALVDAKAGNKFPLTDPVVLSQINQSSRRADASAAVGVANTSQLATLVIDAEANWARSMAHLGLGQIVPSRTALNAAAASTRALLGSVQPDSIVWLRALLERQRGRIEAGAGNFTAAVAGYDCALLALENAAPPPALNCLFDASLRRGSLPPSPTAIAETQLERASYRARQPNVDQAALLRDYGNAVETLTSGSGGNGSAPPSLANYLDALVKASAAAPSPAIDDQFFRALQASGEPAVAREFVRLQSVVASDNAVQAQLADRGDLERQITRLRYQIQALPPGDPALAPLTEAQAAARRALAEINAKLPQALDSVDDKPVAIADVRAALKPGEDYLKLAVLSGRTYAIAIGGAQTMIYRVALSAAAIDALTDRVLTSAHSYTAPDGSLRLRSFSVGDARDLFTQISGPAHDMLVKATAVTFDPVGELRNLPAAVLVTGPDVGPPPPERKTRIDYTNVAFLGRSANLATALSPRSFVLVRGKPFTSAPKPFLGLGENARAPVVTGDAALRPVQLAPGCSVSYADWSATFNGNAPISAREIELSARALGVGNAPSITGADFTDTNVLRAAAAGELAQYEVLHFATHGLTATPYPRAGCNTGLPPSLLTTLTAPDAAGIVQSDGLLSFDKVARLRLNANLVFLSACKTASGVGDLAGRLAGQEDSTPSLDGLVRAFLAANARAVVATMWSVPASPTTDGLITAFYQRGRTASISTALHDAQLGLIDQAASSHPYFWAAYFIVGDGSKMMLGDGKAAVAQAAP